MTKGNLQIIHLKITIHNLNGKKLKEIYGFMLGKKMELIVLTE